MSDKILFVDDEELVLQGARRLLDDIFEIEAVTSAEQGLNAIHEHGPFAAVVSDLRMPGMNGAAFLEQLASRAPLTSRLVLTGSADSASLVEAVNRGQIFRFLLKPCPVNVMRDALLDATRHYRLQRSEAERLERANNGSVRALSEALAVVNPTAHARASRIRQLAVALAKHLGLSNVSDIERAATLSQLGCIDVPERILIEAQKGTERLNALEAETLAEHPSKATRILSKSPPLLPVARIIHLHQRSGEQIAESTESEPIKLAARILRVASDFDLHTIQGVLPRVAVTRMIKQTELYDSRLVTALAEVTQCGSALESISLNVSDICVGMSIEQEVTTKDGRPLVKIGTPVTEALLARLKMFANNVGVNEPILVSAPQVTVSSRWRSPAPPDADHSAALSC